MRRDIAAFLVGGSILVLALEARPVATCFAQSLNGPYPGSPKLAPLGAERSSASHQETEQGSASHENIELSAASRVTGMRQQVLVTQRDAAHTVPLVVVRPAPGF